MISIFRKIRQKLLKQNQLTRYLFYAVGEIALVMVGILLALQVNNWNEENKNAKREYTILTNLQQDLMADSLRLLDIKNQLDIAVRYKRVFENHLNRQVQERDSLNDHFLKQYNLLIDFIPNSTTLDESNSTIGLSQISNSSLRRQVVILYNNYDDLILKLKIGQEKGQFVVDYVSEKVENINQVSYEEVLSLLEDKFYVNQTRMNFLSTQLEAVEDAYQHCSETLILIRKVLTDD